MCSLRGGSARALHAPGASKEAGCCVLEANRKGTVKENSSACLLEAGELVPKRSMATFCPMAAGGDGCCVPPLEGCEARQTLGLPCLLSPSCRDATSLPFPRPSHVSSCPPTPVFLQREPLQPEAIACRFPLCKETSQGFQASASSCTRSRLPTDQTQGKRAPGIRGAEVSSVLSPRVIGVHIHPANACLGRDCSSWLWLGRMVSRLDPTDGSTMVSLCSRVGISNPPLGVVPLPPLVLTSLRVIPGNWRLVVIKVSAMWFGRCRQISTSPRKTSMGRWMPLSTNWTSWSTVGWPWRKNFAVLRMVCGLGCLLVWGRMDPRAALCPASEIAVVTSSLLMLGLEEHKGLCWAPRMVAAIPWTWRCGKRWEKR